MKTNAIGVGMVLAAGGGALGQCEQAWLRGDRVPGLNGEAFATVLWDPPGPPGPTPVVGGQFTVAGGEFAAAVAMWDGAAWRAMGPGLGHGRSETVHAIAVTPNGELIATGAFVESGARVVNNIARWTGSAWTEMGSGLTDGLSAFGTWGGALAVTPDGRVIVGGSFASAGGVAANSIARWDGSAWTAMGSGFAPGWVTAIAVLTSGEVIAAARVYQNDQWQYVVRKWDEAGLAWNDMGPVFSNYVYALLARANGQVIAGGSFLLNGVRGAAQWNGGQWTPLGTGISFGNDGGLAVRSLALLPGGAIAASGSFEQAGGIGAHDVAVWNGAQWGALGNSTGVKGGSLVVLPDGRLMMNGNSVWDGQVWTTLMTGGPTASVRAVKYLPKGDLVAGGDFTEAYGVTLNHIGRRDEQGWHALGSGTNAVVRTILVEGNEVIAGGDFTVAGGRSCGRIAKWDGTEWTALGPGIGDGSVNAIVRLPSGELVAAGRFASAGNGPALSIAKWNGLEWMPIGAGFDAEIQALAVLSGWELVAGGYFYGDTAKVMKWDGSTWAVMGERPPIGRVMALAAMPGNELYAGGYGSSIPPNPLSFIALRWTDGAWSPLLPVLGNMTASVNAIEPLSDGTLEPIPKPF